MTEKNTTLKETHQYRVKPGSTVKLDEMPTTDDARFPFTKEEGKNALKDLNAKIAELQELLYAEGKHKLLIILQAMDAGGKDGTIKNVYRNMDARGLRVASFNKPTDTELARDYLWRVHAEVPKKGECVIFNRSHYEDILAVRVRKLMPESIWSKRYDHIVDFEKMLTDEGTLILKFFLNISQEEQKNRLQSRIDDPSKHWKLHPDDFNDRKLWPTFIQAYEDVLSRTSSNHAPWYVIPANKKWQRNLAIAEITIQALKNLNMHLPPPDFDPSTITLV